MLGVTFKEDVPDVRNSKAVDVIDEVRSFGLTLQVCDPEADARAAKHEYGIELVALDAMEKADALIINVAHRAFVEAGWDLVMRLLNPGGVVLDVKGYLDRAKTPDGVILWRM